MLGLNINKKNGYLLSILAMSLAACGGGGGGGNSTTLTGAFIDSAVAGINYSTTTQSGTTNAAGEFNYLEGETVTFSIGDIVLPAVSAGALVTPIGMVPNGSSSNTTVVNIARLLQTLDENGNPSDGITITSAAHAAANGMSVDFTSATFESDPNIINLVANSGSVNATLISSADAIAHLQTTLSGISIVGSWFTNSPGYNILFTFSADGSYVHAEDGNSDPGGQDGMERGTYTWDMNSGAFSSTCPSVDTNGQWGLSHPDGANCTGTTANMTVSGNTLTIEIGGNSFQLSRVADTNSSIVGSWYTNSPGYNILLTFFADGSYVHAEDGNTDPSGQDGMERGTYTWDMNSGAFNSTCPTVDTNGQWGLSHPNPPACTGSSITVSVNGDTIDLGSYAIQLTRVVP